MHNVGKNRFRTHMARPNMLSFNPLFVVCPRNYESVREECHLKNCCWVGVAIPWAGERIYSYFLKLDGRSGSKTEVPGFARLSSSGAVATNWQSERVKASRKPSHAEYVYVLTGFEKVQSRGD
jgi:hypothetical protein